MKKSKNNEKTILYAAITVLVVIIILSAIKIPYTDITSYTEKTPTTETKNIPVKEKYQTEDCYEQNTTYSLEWGNIERECLKQECIKERRKKVDDAKEKRSPYNLRRKTKQTNS